MRLARSAVANVAQQKTETEIRGIQIGLGFECGLVLSFCFGVVSFLHQYIGEVAVKNGRVLV